VTYSNPTDQEELDYQLDLANLFKIITKRKNIISIFSFFGILFSSIYIYSQKRIFSGSFSFVYDNNTNTIGNFSELPDILEGFTNSSSNNIKTEKEILTSPYILKSVYEKVKSLKNSSDKETDNWKFEDFSSSIIIEIKKGTDVIKVSYKDKDKDIILPILNEVSEAYKEYSVQEQVELLNNTIEYLEKQVDSLRIQSRENILKTEQYGLNNGIINEIEGLNLYEFKKIDINNLSKIKDSNSIEKKDTRSDSKINRYSYLFTLLQQLEVEKLQKSIYLKPNDPGMILISKKIENLKEALTKPKEVLIKYNELLRYSRGQEELLALLEQQYEAIKLEKAKASQPWLVISQPKLNERPIGPKRLLFIFTSFILSTFFGLVTALIYNKKKGYLFSLDEHKKVFNCNYVPIKYTDKDVYQNDLFLYLKTNISLKKNQKLAFLTISENDLILEDFVSLIKSLCDKNEVVMTDELSKISEYDYIFLLVIEGYTNQVKLHQIKNSLTISRLKLFSTIYLY
tara:strand:+ start:2171 stop:3709 length:1539 start_codon:yes stop_codon:yes gene_type:complete